IPESISNGDQEFTDGDARQNRNGYRDQQLVVVPDGRILREQKATGQGPAGEVQPGRPPLLEDVHTPKDGQEDGRQRLAEVPGYRGGVGELSLLRSPMGHRELGEAVRVYGEQPGEKSSDPESACPEHTGGEELAPRTRLAKPLPLLSDQARDKQRGQQPSEQLGHDGESQRKPRED